MKLRPLLTLLACLVLASGSLPGHSVWIEPDANGACVIRFAEPDGRLERSPGHLDSLILPTAWAMSGDTNPITVSVTKQVDHFSLSPATGGTPLLAETAFTVMGTHGATARRPMFYARWHPVGAPGGSPAMNLDLVPLLEAGRVQVFFRGKPLAGVRAVLRTPDEREQELLANEDGILEFRVSQAGLHRISVARHRESVGGYAGGREYGLTSHNACLSWVQPTPE